MPRPFRRTGCPGYHERVLQLGVAGEPRSLVQKITPHAPLRGVKNMVMSTRCMQGTSSNFQVANMTLAVSSLAGKAQSKKR
jgi:hypothetical protein